MIQYRTFQNADPPQVLALWHDCGLGRGAVTGVPCDAFESLNYAQPYFDARGLLLACDNGRLVGLIHAGFAANDEQNGLCRETGVICAVLVRPGYRRRGIGRQLVQQAEHYLQQAGARQIFAGPADPRDPFFFGLYGGSQPAGFLLSDPTAGQFFRGLGYEPAEQHAVFQRSIAEAKDPVSVRLVEIRRKTQLAIAHQRQHVSWWWVTRYGRLDSVRFQLMLKGQTKPVAGVTVIGLDLYLHKWQERAIGLSDLYVPEEHRGHGYGQALIVEVCRRMREELVTRVEAHAPESNAAMMKLLPSAGFERVDTGVVYQRSGSTGEPASVAPGKVVVKPVDPSAEETVELKVSVGPGTPGNPDAAPGG